MFVTTINKTPESYALAIVAAEYLLNLVPKGTHEWNKFVKPEDLTKIIEKSKKNIYFLFCFFLLNKKKNIYIYTGCFFLFSFFLSQFFSDSYNNLSYSKPGHMIHFLEELLNRILLKKN